MNALEIVTDASIKKYEESGRTFGCAGALCINTGQERYMISQDTTNNRVELLGIYLGISLAINIYNKNPGKYDDVIIYSDSKIGIYGLTRWMDQWLSTMDSSGIMYGSNGKPVKNQELFGAILCLLVESGIKIKFRHCRGHVVLSTSRLEEANRDFLQNNGYKLRPEDIYKVEYYNDQIDKRTRAKLQNLNPNIYPVRDYSNTFNLMSNIKFPKNYKQYVG